jgi:2-amino-4-hydroxy-6-hydroxymethyldihydropteridine diphosphokinase
MNGKYLLLGSNTGNRLENLNHAKGIIRERMGIIDSESPVYQTSPWGLPSQPDFYNQVLRIKTNLEPGDLLKEIIDLENEMGRIRKKKWDKRIIDIDILFYENRIINEDRLKIPHPLIPERLFVLVPLADIAADEIHPFLNIPVKELLKRTSDTSTYKKLEE